MRKAIKSDFTVSDIKKGNIRLPSDKSSEPRRSKHHVFSRSPLKATAYHSLPFDLLQAQGIALFNAKATILGQTFQCNPAIYSEEFQGKEANVINEISASVSVAEVPCDEPVFSVFPLSTILQDVSKVPLEPAAHRKLKKKRIPWSDAEKSALKEGVRRYGRSDKQLP
ncbi:hypothetical protein POM88_032815 [Heracleum sosnowskyi]|uniref:Uncharacterized protein n=1 Tax=Heracleum sosnowskyi TaxID=360622 RepID=A0AAD8MKZ4_9APIA|nr:hypothetical protein POM88_032815 [Heracleum sosnowskyi]